MAREPNKLLQSIFWPVSVWPSFQHMKHHAADDYVERTTPILGTAAGFWLCAVALAVLYLITYAGVPTRLDVDGVSQAARVTWRGGEQAVGVLLFFLPILYAVGFWMFFSREEDYPN